LSKIIFMANPAILPFEIILREFEYNGVQFKVALAPEVYPDEDGLDFTGNYSGILISSKKGTKTFELLVDHHQKWQTVPKGMDPGLVDILDDIIQELRQTKDKTSPQHKDLA